MRGFKFKSLAMRIWATFTIIILLITTCLSIIYIYIFRYMDTKVKTQDLMNVHITLLESNFSEPLQFDLLRSLRGAFHLTYSDGIIHDIGRPPMRDMPAPNMNPEKPMPQVDNFALREWIINLATPEMYQNSFNQKYDGINFILAISWLSDDTYFISYMPNYYDNSMMYYMLVASGIFIMVGFVAANIVAQYISKPLYELENFTYRIAAKDWKEPIELKNKDEIGRLAKSMNKMQDALKRADEEEKVFLQSISHDLKTPVMVIMSHADAILDGIYVDTLDKTAQVIKDEAQDLNRKIKQLLYLNTLDYALENTSGTAVIEVEGLLRHIVDRFEILGSHLDWKFDIQAAKIRGNEEKLIIAIENIIDNAIRYAQSEISIMTRKTKDMVCIDLFNDGAQISSGNLDKIFNSLYKDKTGNFGLGLAITKKIITFFDGNVYAKNRENGVSFIIEFPSL